MIDVLSYALKLGGVLFLVVAAVGVLRLPDAFTRMHAATKAGTLGAGLVVLGSALSLRGAESIALAIVTLVILLATVPLASHLLGRAAYTSGAPFWRGTARDALEGTLRRGERPGADDDPAPSSAEATAIERIVVAPTHGAEGASATRAGQLAGATGLSVATLGMIDPTGLDADAFGVARERLGATLERARTLVGGRTSIDLYEGEPDDALDAALRPGDLLVLPAAGWYDHGARPADDDALEAPVSGRRPTTLALAQRAPRPVLLASERPRVERIVLLDDGSPAIEGALATLATLNPFPGGMIRVTWEAGTEETPERRAALTRAAGALDIGFRAPGGDGMFRAEDDLVVCRRMPGAARGDWYGQDWRDRIAPGWRGGVLLV